MNILLHLAKAHYDAKRYDRAAPVYGEACRAAPEDPRPRFYLGLTRMMQDRPEEAVEDFEAALVLETVPAKVDFNYADIHLMLGKVYQERLGRVDLALIHYKKVLELDPRYPQREALSEMIKLWE